MNADATCRDAVVSYQDGVLKVSNAHLERTWKWTGSGFATTSLVSVGTGKGWTRPDNDQECDWQLPGHDDPQRAELKGVTVLVSDDEGFTSEHVEAVAEISYPEAKVLLRFTVWVYPDTPGIRTQLHLKALDGYDSRAGTPLAASHRRVDFAPINFGGLKRRMLGYYNETQQRNDTCEDILKEETLGHELKNREFHTWPSALCVEDGDQGVAVVKESHKCPNQVGYDCGLFVCEGDVGLSNLGWGLSAREIDDTWRRAWATWWMVYQGGDRGRETAFKLFDATRYPLDAARDIYVQANTWGSGDDCEESRRAAIESAVLEELESCADLGIDILQIDDGWQVPPGHRIWHTEEGIGWRPHPESYPEGWGPIRKRAGELGIKLGLWAAAVPISLEELEESFLKGGFQTYKLDFASLGKNEEIRALMAKVRDFVKSTGHKVRVNWDVTEVSRRYGYFFAREFGCLYLANRKPVWPPSTTYRPHTMLRDLWQLSKYINLRKIQGSVQNVDRVNPRLSDAGLHSHDYCLAVTLMSTPLFFQQTVYYTEAARQQLRPLLATFKQHRDEMFKGVVYPIGSKPDNYSWTGFQNHNGESNSGYLTLFRELNNDDATATLNLQFVAGRDLNITNLLDGSQRQVVAGSDGEVEFSCDTAPGYLFLKYE